LYFLLVHATLNTVAKISKPKIEDVIYEVLADDAQKNALDFAAFLRANKCHPDGLLRTHGKFYLSDEKLKDMVWNNVGHCTKCYNCKPGNEVTVLGKQFDEVCHSWLMMKNPDVDTLNCAKKKLLMKNRQ